MSRIVTDIIALRKKSTEVGPDEALELMGFLRSAMTEYNEQALGLCLPQIGIPKRALIIDHDGLVLNMVNPVIIKKSKQKSKFPEGCLSLPGTVERPITVERPKRITVKYTNLDGEDVKEKYDGIIAKAIQHEIDHLDGILILDYKRD